MKYYLSIDGKPVPFYLEPERHYVQRSTPSIAPIISSIIFLVYLAVIYA